MLSLDPLTTAVVVVDMQNDFCHADGYYAKAGRDVSPLVAAVAPVAALIARARAAGSAIYYTRLVHDSRLGAMEERHALRPKRWTTSGKRLQAGTWGAAVVDELAPAAADIVIDKAGYSAFESTELERHLTDRRTRAVVLCGVVTYACILATAFSAFDRGFDVVLAADAAGTWNAGLGHATSDIVDLLLGHSVVINEINFSSARGARVSNTLYG
jgi:nicotinamidase-related amidase